MKKLTFILLSLIALGNSVNAQSCNNWFTSTDQGNGNFYFNGNSNYPSGYVGHYDWDFGDGRADYTYYTTSLQTGYTYNSFCPPYLNHHYIANGTYVVSFTLHSVDPNNPSLNCTSTVTDTIVVSGLPNCTLSGAITYNKLNSSSFNFLGNDVNSVAFEYAEWHILETGYVLGVNGSYNATNFGYTFPAPGQYTVCLYLVDSTASGVCYDTTCTSINVGQPSCVASFGLWQDSLSEGTWYGSNNSIGNNLTYLWDFGDGTIDTAAYPSHTYAALGHYVICLTITSQTDTCTSIMCDTSSAHKMSSNAGMSSFTVVNPLGIKNNKPETLDVTIYPNPASEALFVRAQFNKNIFTTIKNNLGEVVLQDKMLSNNSSIDISKLLAGIYFISLSDGEKQIVKKFIKE